MTATTRRPWSPNDDENEIAGRVVGLLEYGLAELASSALAVVLDRTTGLPQPGSEGKRSQRTAVVVAAARAFRTVRAAMAVVCRGYELEADMMTRVILELYVGSKAVLDEPTGAEAKRWLTRGVGKKIAARIDAAVAQGSVYGALSRVAHGDPRAMLTLTVKGDPPTIDWGPQTSLRAADILRHFAVAARDFAVLLEEATGEQHPEITRLDQILKENVDGFEPDGKREAR